MTAAPWAGKRPTPEQIAQILALHSQWCVTRGRDGSRADLTDAVLTGADLAGADLRGADRREHGDIMLAGLDALMSICRAHGWTGCEVQS